ncbi:MAG: proline dehydrogenase family protein [Bacteroidota bacterium]|nr:proline dehydrogenase family protein [Bacteroidota bacterium]
MLSFDNTGIAYGNKSDTDLKRACYLFRIMSKPLLVKTAKVMFRIAHALHIPFAWAVKPHLYKQFVGGETLEDCLPLVRRLEKYNVKAILDYSVEKIVSEKYIHHPMDEFVMTIDEAAIDSNIPFAVFKPTALCSEEILEKAATGNLKSANERKEANKFRTRVEILCRHAFFKKVRIMIDAEDSWYQSFIDDVAEEMMEKFNKETAIVYNTLQMYRVDRFEYLKSLYERAREKEFFLGIKLVRGAYMEKERARAAALGYPSPIQPDREATDRSFDEALHFAMRHVDRIYIFNGTHNENSTRLLVELMQRYGIEKTDERCYFSQLYGMSDNISFTLAGLGYNVAKYVPYGPVEAVMPYLIRRAEENTAIASQTGRELNLIRQELQRRKKEA